MKKILLSLLVTASALSQPAPLIHGPRTEKKIALTFDACSPTRHPGYDSAVVHILRDSACPATLFLGGRWMQRYPAVTRRLVKDPLFAVGTHGYSHKLLTALPRDSVVLEIQQARTILARETGSRSKLFRAPFAVVDSAILHIIDSLGLIAVQYDIASGDPDSSFTKAVLIHWVNKAVQEGSIIVFHMNLRGLHTAEALPEIIGTLRARGFQFVKIDEFVEKRGG